MKKMTKTISLALAMIFIMSFALVIPASAGSITVNRVGTLLLDGTFSAYKVFDVVESGGDYAYTIVPAFATFANYPNSGSLTLQQYLTAQTSNSVAMEELAANLWTFIQANSITAAASQTVSNATSAVISGLDPGYYLVFGGKSLSTDVPPQELFSACILTTIDPDATVNVKTEMPTIEKKVEHHTGDGVWQETTDVNIGDIVKFQLSSKVPKTAGYTKYEFIMHDTMSAGLTFDHTAAATNIVVKIGATTLTYGTHYTLNTATLGTAPTDGCTFEIVFNDTLLLNRTTYPFDTPIVAEYTAVLNENAFIGAEGGTAGGNINEVLLEYSNNPRTTDKGKTPKRRVRVYTFEFDILKYYDDPTQGTPPPLRVYLEGAKFKLYKSYNEATEVLSNEVGLVSVSTADDVNVYRPKKSAETAIASMVSPEDGLIKVKGLDEGVYWLEEIEAPEGYNLLEKPIKIEITHTGAGASTLKVDDTLATTAEVENNSGVEFPGTGSIGTVPFIVVGVLLMGGAVVMLVVRRKKARSH